MERRHLFQECGIMMYITCMPVLDRLNSLFLFVTEVREMAFCNAFFPEVARCSVALLLFRFFIPEAIRNSYLCIK